MGERIRDSPAGHLSVLDHFAKQKEHAPDENRTHGLRITPS